MDNYFWELYKKDEKIKEKYDKKLGVYILRDTSMFTNYFGTIEGKTVNFNNEFNLCGFNSFQTFGEGEIEELINHLKENDIYMENYDLLKLSLKESYNILSMIRMERELKDFDLIIYEMLKNTIELDKENYKKKITEETKQDFDNKLNTLENNVNETNRNIESRVENLAKEIKKENEESNKRNSVLFVLGLFLDFISIQYTSLYGLFFVGSLLIYYMFKRKRSEE